MNKNKLSYNPLPIIFFLLIGIALIIVGSFKDLEITFSVYSAENTSAFGIIGLLIGEVPVGLSFAFAGAMAFNVGQRDKRFVSKFFGWCFLLGSILVALFSCFKNVLDLKDFSSISNTEFYIIAAIDLALLLPVIALVFFKTYKRANELEVDRLHKIFVYIYILLFSEIFIQIILKNLASRPRPSYIYSINDYGAFRNWWEFKPLDSLKISGCDGFPSGHTIHSSFMLFVLPLTLLIKKEYKEDKGLTSLLMYAGGLLGVIVGVSRLFAGGHFMSDIGWGITLAMVLGFIITIIFNNTICKKDPIKIKE